MMESLRLRTVNQMLAGVVEYACPCAQFATRQQMLESSAKLLLASTIEYNRQLKTGSTPTCTVQSFALNVASHWPERFGVPGPPDGFAEIAGNDQENQNTESRWESLPPLPSSLLSWGDPCDRRLHP